jgi:hypothetical protein
MIHQRSYELRDETAKNNTIKDFGKLIFPKK